MPLGRRPAGLFDVQIAAALVGVEYPAGYGTLVSKLLGHKFHKHETRSDWRRRPLSKRQIEYALTDVLYLPELRGVLHQRLEQLGRSELDGRGNGILAGRGGKIAFARPLA